MLTNADITLYNYVETPQKQEWIGTQIRGVSFYTKQETAAEKTGLASYSNCAPLRLNVVFNIFPPYAPAASVIVTAQTAVLFPSMVVTVISAFPAEIPETSPVTDTVAFVSSLLVHSTVLSVASSGSTVATSVSFAATSRVSADLFSVTPVTAVLGRFAFRRKCLCCCVKFSLGDISNP